MAILRRDATKEQIRAVQAAAELALLADAGEPKASDPVFFEQYKIMVASSESLVARRQGVNTFFLTIHGLILTAAGLFVKSGGTQRLQAGGVLVLAGTGLMLCYSWYSLLLSFGQLNAGKFRIINAMEKKLPAAIFGAEWIALGEGKEPKIYGSFTTRETWVPVALGVVYLLATVLSFIVWVGWLHLGG